MMWELPFWLSLLLNSLLPATQTPWVEIASIPVASKDIILLVATCFYLLPVGSYSSIITFHKPWHYHLPIVTTILLSYAAISVVWSGMEPLETTAMLYTLILTLSAFWQGYNLITKRSSKFVRPFLWRIVVFIAVVGLLYSAESFFSLGLRSVTSTYTDFAIERVRGPLFGSATGYFILLPALAFALQEMIETRVLFPFIFKLTVVVALMITLLGLGSRASLIIFCIFLVFLLFFTKDKKQRLFSMAIIIIVATIAAFLVFSKANADRLTSFEDDSRSETHLTSFKVIQNRSEFTNIFGSGYGSYWPWHLRDVEFLNPLDPLHESNKIDNPLYDPVHTPFGDMLYNPHSVFLLLMVELGFPGLLYLFALFKIFFQILFRNLRGGPSSIFTCGVAASGFSIFFDFYIFKYPQINVIWWIFFLGALALPITQTKVSKKMVLPRIECKSIQKKLAKESSQN